MGYGFEGTAMAFNTTILFSFTSMVLYTMFTRDKEIRKLLVPFSTDIQRLINVLALNLLWAYHYLL